MSRKKGQVFSAEQKTKIVLELLKEEQTIAQLATKYGVTAKSIHNWKAQFLNNASLATSVLKGGKSYIYKYNFKRFHSSIGSKQPMNYYQPSVQKVA